MKANKESLYFKVTWWPEMGKPKERFFDSASAAQKFLFKKDAEYEAECHIHFGWCEPTEDKDGGAPILVLG